MAENPGPRALVATASLVVPIAAALAASTMLLVDHLRPAAVFCADASSGCATLRHSPYAAPFGVPLPVVGALGFLALAVLALWPGEKARRAHLVLAALGAIVAAYLIVLQITLQTFCKFCLVVDTSAVLVLLGAILRYRTKFDPPPVSPRAIGAAVFAVAVVVPASLGALAPPPPPPPAIDVPAETPLPIRVEMAMTPKGKITLVDFVDFECPFCRRLHGVLQAFLEEHGAEVRVVRKNVPLDMHPHARDAARAAVCGTRLGKGDAMADALFEAPEEELTPEGTRALAERLGLDGAAFAACVADPTVERAIDADILDYRITNGAGLPTLWFDGERIVGLRPRAQLEAAFERAKARAAAGPAPASAPAASAPAPASVPAASAPAAAAPR